MILAEPKDIRSPFPTGLFDWDGRVEPMDRKFHHAPKQVISILRFAAYGSDCHLDFQIQRREKTRKDFHESRSTVRITFRTKTRDKQAFKVELEADNVEGHQGKQISSRQLLELIIEVDRVLGGQCLQCRKDGKSLLQKTFEGRARVMCAGVGPSLAHLLMNLYDIAVAQEDIFSCGG